jgi:hypothetical protein
MTTLPVGTGNEVATMSTNTFESRIAGVTVQGEAHSLGVWFVVALRLIELRGGKPTLQS